MKIEKVIPELRQLPLESYIITQTQAMQILNRYYIEFESDWSRTRNQIELDILDIYSSCENIVTTPETRRYKQALTVKLATLELVSMSQTAEEFFKQFTSTHTLFYYLSAGKELEKPLKESVPINTTFVQKHFKYFWDRYDR